MGPLDGTARPRDGRRAWASARRSRPSWRRRARPSASTPRRRRPTRRWRLGGRRRGRVRGDLADADECARVVDEAAAALGGGLDGLVNNAGITRELASRTRARMTSPRCSTSTSAATSSAPRGRSRHFGSRSIVNLSSIHGHGGLPWHAATRPPKARSTRGRGPRRRARAARGAGQRGGAGRDRGAAHRERGPGYDRCVRPVDPAGRVGTPGDVARWSRSCCRARRVRHGQVIYVDGGTLRE